MAIWHLGTHWLSNAEVISLVFSVICPTPNLQIQWQNTPLQPVFLFIYFYSALSHHLFISLSRHYRGLYFPALAMLFSQYFLFSKDFLDILCLGNSQSIFSVMTNISTFYIKSTKHFYWHHPFNELTFFSNAPI